MPFKNKIKQFSEKEGISIYKMVQDTGVSRTTLYELSADPNRRFAIETIQKLCDHYECQPGEFIEWIKAAKTK